MFRCILIAICFTNALILISASAMAELTQVEVIKHKTFEFKAKQYESIEGYFHFQFSPSKPANLIVTDIEFAPTNVNGNVTAKARFFLIQPVDQKVKGTLFEISNRGSKAALRYFNQAPRDLSPQSAESLGDGLIQDLNLRMLWVGWQGDVPENDDAMYVSLPTAKGIEGLVRSDWTLDEKTSQLQLSHRNGVNIIYPYNEASKQTAYLTKRMSRAGQRTIIDANTWQFSDDGKSIEGKFSPGIYELVYPSKDPLVVGLGLAIIRDTAEYLKSKHSQFQTDKVIGFGVSQTGRLLRHFLYQGFNKTENGDMAFDGMLIHTAGAGRGSFNHRFAQASRDAHRLSTFFYPTDLFPFTSRPTRHPITGLNQGLFNEHNESFKPKIFYTNTGYEYWGRGASLIHTSFLKDVTPLDNERIYHLASGQHFVEQLDNLRKVEEGIFIGNPLDFLTNLRALLKSLNDWVVDDLSPPESQFPRYEKAELVSSDNYQLPKWLGRLKTPIQPHTAYFADYGQQWEQGIVDMHPPRLLAEIVPSIPKVDKWGNEQGGLRHPFIEEPLAAFLPWAIRNQGFAPNEMADFRGTLALMDKQDVLARYENWQAYSAKLNAAIDEAINSKTLLARDRDRLAKQAQWLWNKIMESSD